jgi:2-phospho-L-lactate guanylyltransferase
MFQDVLSALKKVGDIDQVVVVAAEPAVEFAAEENVVVLTDELQEGQSAATLLGIRWAQSRGYDRVLLVPGDAPLIDPAEVDALLASAEADGTALVIVPDRHHEGTNALLIAPPDAVEPRVGPGSLERHIDAARSAGVSHRVEPVPSLVLDVDTSDDLVVVQQAIDERRTLAPRTRGALRQLDRAGARH